jgi:hypothetical protein
MTRFRCRRCDGSAAWVRRTQFSGDFYFCTPCAELEPDFVDECDPSYFFWEEVLQDVI